MLFYPTLEHEKLTTSSKAKNLGCIQNDSVKEKKILGEVKFYHL